MRTLVLGDIHGCYRALEQCFELSGFDRDRDRLIFLGDAVDGWSGSAEAIEALRRVSNLTYILGNHDVWFMEWVALGLAPPDWLVQGGRATVDAYRKPEWQGKRREHLEFLKQGEYYHLDGQNRLFVHGSVAAARPLGDQDTEAMLWGRGLFYAVDGLADYDEVYIGHTPTLTVDQDTPLNFGSPDNIWRMDTGAGWYGRLSIMDVDTKEVWQSETVTGLYPGERGRC